MIEWNIKNYDIEDGFCGEYSLFLENEKENKEKVLNDNDFKLFVDKKRFSIYYNKKNKYICLLKDVNGDIAFESYCDGIENLVDYLELIEVLLMLVEE